VLTDVDAKSEVMQEEIFGPILPVIRINDVDEAISFINQREKPLALYVFSNNSSLCKRVLESTSSGGALSNDCLMHMSVHTLPFGGVGQSGTGSYHGKQSFDICSHKKSLMLKQLNLEDVNTLRYPPYTDTKRKWLESILLEKIDTPTRRMGRLFLKGAVLVLVAGIGWRLF